MSLFSWLFSQKESPRPMHVVDSSGLPSMEATRPAGRHAQHHSDAANHASKATTARKTERMARRELLYAVIRECMMRAGVLTSGYKFKVLSLDSRGRQFLVMVDLARGHEGSAGSLPEIEAMIAQAAKARHELLVTAVYWRMIDHVSVGAPVRPHSAPHAQAHAHAPAPASHAGEATHVPPAKPAAHRPAQAPVQAPAVAPAKAPAAAEHGTGFRETDFPPTEVPAGAPERRGPGYDPIRDDEVEAFRRALAAGVSAPAIHATAPAHHPTPPDTQGHHNPAAHNYALLTGFEDTELPENAPREPLLSGTQYGELK